MEEPEQSDTKSITQVTQALQKRHLTSAICKDFVSVWIENDGKERGKCIHCSKKFVIKTKTHGIKYLSRQLEKCENDALERRNTSI